MVNASLIMIALVVSTSIQAQPSSAWSQPGAYQADNYQRPKSQWSRPNAYRAPKSTWSTNGFAAAPKGKSATELVERSEAPKPANERVDGPLVIGRTAFGRRGRIACDVWRREHLHFLDHRAWHKASDLDGITVNLRHQPDHRSTCEIRLRDQGIVWYIDPLAIKPDPVMAVL
jgi:hypothetical protein